MHVPSSLPPIARFLSVAVSVVLWVVVTAGVPIPRQGISQYHPPHPSIGVQESVRRILVVERPGEMPLVYVEQATKLQLLTVVQSPPSKGSISLQNQELGLNVGIDSVLEQEAVCFVRPLRVSSLFHKLFLAAGVELDEVTLLRAVYFDPSSDLIRNDASVELDKVASLLDRYPSSRLMITARTDSKGSQAYNQILASRRGKAVLRYLQENGVDDLQRMVIQTLSSAADRSRSDRVNIIGVDVDQIGRRAEFMFN